MTIPTQEDVPAAIDRVDAADAGGEDGWASRAAFTMLLEDVSERRVVEALDEVAAQVEASGESARELFGDPDAWVAERRSRWREAGEEHITSSRSSVKDLMGETLVIAAMYSGLFIVYFLLRSLVTWTWGEPLSLSLLLAPLVLAVVSRAMHGAFIAVRAAFSHVLGVLAAVLTLAAGVAVAVGVFLLAQGIMIGDSALLGMLGTGVGCAVLGAAVVALWPERPARTDGAAPRDDDDWARALAVALRERGDMTDAHVAELVAEARVHGRDAGTTLAEEFGAPRAYAARFPGSRRVPGRRKAWLSTGLVALVLIYVVASAIDGTTSPWGIAWLVVAAALAVSEWRSVRRG